MKLLRIVFLSVMCLVALQVNLFAQDKKATVLTIDNDNITLEEFENIFRKNNRDSSVTQQSLDEYMELFINFKLKVKEARELGMDTVVKFRSELQGYRSQLARPYLTDSEMLDELVNEAYRHMNEEVRAQHILIKCDMNASPEDTLKAYSKIVAIRERIMKGDDFVTVAKETSEEPTAKENGGELGYFTAFQMVYPFEQAAYGTKVGEVSRPIRTRYGYHVLKVVDRRVARGEIHTAHIMIKEKQEPNGAQNAQDKANEIYQKILAGESFEELATKYSEDQSTSKKGGELPWFGTNKMVIEFEDAAYSLTQDGQVSPPVKTTYGWHIIKRLGYRPVSEFSVVEKDIRSKVSKDSRAEITRNSFINKLKKEYKYNYNTKSVEMLAAKADTNAYYGNIKAKKKVLTSPLVEINGVKYTNQDFIAYLKTKKAAKSKLAPKDYIRVEADAFAKELLMKYEDTQLEKKHDAFRLLVNEYREGILLFELTDQKVWSRAVKDSAGLNAFYENNKTKFLWPDRVDATIYSCANDTIANEVRMGLKEGLDKAAIATEINADTQLNLQIEEGVYSKEDKEILNRVEWKPGASQNVAYNGQVYIVVIREVIPSAPKRLNEAKGLVTSEYQNYLEQEWIKELRSKHTFKVDKNVLHSIK